jgi:Tfp pilus assembly protein PilW
MKIFFTKQNKGYTRLVDFGDAISSRTKGASPKLTTGYTIIETMIAISLFLVVVMTGMTALLNANLLHQKSQNMRSIIDNLSFIMEDMSRNIRTGSNFHCAAPGDTLSNLSTAKSGPSCWAVAFRAADGVSLLGILCGQ